ncbi:hypothetical protein [Nodosilinea sp. P-1105]|uniref:hypothetical protein n=1 Tax=Nodosilinea sp. P-1105 TaxID=2546229 RepID=UPI00146AE886|nr:hypothetical protein [Nodosilinea sp. P-1105]NMF83201.1 hypothetical protein [Nodosilinea sp. P-1105]
MTSATDSSATDLAAQLQAALDLARQVETHSQAQAAFQTLLADVQAQNPELASLFEQLWQAHIRSQRSSRFWEQVSEVEKGLSDRLTESHIQLKQNYLRLMQEQ